MGSKGRVDELSVRVLSLLDINEKAEKAVEELLSKIRVLNIQCGGLKTQLKNQRAHFELAMKTTTDAEDLARDLRAENRTMRMTIRGLTLPNFDRIDDPLSYGCDSVRPATSALGASISTSSIKSKKVEK